MKYFIYYIYIIYLYLYILYIIIYIVPIGWRTDLDEKVEETFSCHTQSVRVRAAVASVCPYHSQMLVLRVAV